MRLCIVNLPEVKLHSGELPTMRLCMVKLPQVNLHSGKLPTVRLCMVWLGLLIFSQEFVKTLFCSDLGFVAIYVLLG